MNILTLLKAFFRLKIYAPLRINKHASYYSSHSQFGEDMLIRSLFPKKKEGLFVDIGAHHPVYFSNTYHFYLKGWSGLNIDAKPGSMDLFKQFRSRDINIEACIAHQDNEEISFFEFTQAALNTIDPQMAQEVVAKGHKVIKKHTLKTKTIKTILKEASIDGRNIDFCNIDIEGVDKIILEENDWDFFKPKVIAFEDHCFDVKNIKNCETLTLLMQKGYEFTGKCGPTIIVKLS